MQDKAVVPAELQLFSHIFKLFHETLRTSIIYLKTYPKIFEIESRIQESECRRRANDHDSSCHCSIYSGFWLLAPEFPGVNKY
jgi:hypothetical protein